MVDALLKSDIVAQLNKAKSHLEYSYKKVQKISLKESMPETELESLDSFASRFARYSDILIMKYFRMLAFEKDPAFRGSVIDLLNTAEKFNWIDSATIWRRIRQLRNVAAHDYTNSEYIKLYGELIQLTPQLLNVSLDL